MMDIIKEKWKKNFLLRAWEKCKSPKKFPLTKSKSWSSTTSTKHPDGQVQEKTTNNKIKTKRKDNLQVTPCGCFSVYVGPEKQRFVVKTKFASHPLFKMLLEDAELEYGFTSDGPILLPCEVDLFYKVLAEMDNCGDDIIANPPSWSPLILCSPSRRHTSAVRFNGYKGHSAYRLLSPSKLLKLNTI